MTVPRPTAYGRNVYQGGGISRRPVAPPPPPAPTFLAVAEVASKLRVSKMTIYRLIHDGVIPAVRVRRSFRIKVTDIEQFLRDEAVVDFDE